MQMRNQRDQLCSRRHLLQSSSFGLGALAAAWLLRRDGWGAEPTGLQVAGPAKPELEPQSYDLQPKPAHFPPQARAMISMFMLGGPSQIDLFDPKPELIKRQGESFAGDLKFDNPAQASREIMAPLWKFRHWGKCGMQLSELLPHLGGVADEITLIRSMHTGVNNHLPSNYALNTGAARSGRAVLGSWLLHALGCEAENLPAYVALTDPRGLPLIGAENWGQRQAAFDLSRNHGAAQRAADFQPRRALRNLHGAPQRSQLDLLSQINQLHAEQHPGENDLRGAHGELPTGRSHAACGARSV